MSILMLRSVTIVRYMNMYSVFRALHFSSRAENMRRFEAHAHEDHSIISLHVH